MNTKLKGTRPHIKRAKTGPQLKSGPAPERVQIPESNPKALLSELVRILSKREMAVFDRACKTLKLEPLEGLRSAIGCFVNMTRINHEFASNGCFCLDTEEDAEKEFGGGRGALLFAKIMREAFNTSCPSMRHDLLTGLADLIQYNPGFSRQFRDLRSIIDAEISLACKVETAGETQRPLGKLIDVIAFND